MIKIGNVCVKTAGREAGKFCVILDIDEKTGFCVVDGFVKKRKCNIKHLEILPVVVSASKSSSTEAVKKALTEAGFAGKEKEKKKARKAEKTSKPKKTRKTKVKKESKKESQLPTIK